MKIPFGQGHSIREQITKHSNQTESDFFSFDLDVTLTLSNCDLDLQMTLIFQYVPLIYKLTKIDIM